MRRKLIVALTAATAIVASATPALAHAKFDKSQVPAETEIDLTFNAPQERASTTARIEALAPRQFTILECTAPDGWDCEIDTTSQSPETLIIWQVGDEALVPVQAFPFFVRTPLNSEQGVYKWPVIQTYADGFEAEWIGDTAPILQVGDSTAPVVENDEPQQEHGDPATDPAKEPTADPASEAPAPDDDPADAEPDADATTSEAPVAGESVDDVEGDGSDDDSSGPADTTTADTATGDTTTGESVEPVAANPADDDSGAPVGLIVAVIALAAAGGAAFVLRGRTGA